MNHKFYRNRILHLIFFYIYIYIFNQKIYLLIDISLSKQINYDRNNIKSWSIYTEI